jgi:hypothetical protein
VISDIPDTTNANCPIEKMRDLDNLTPLDARNSLLMDPQEYKRSSVPAPFGPRGYEAVPLSEQNTGYKGARPFGDREHEAGLLGDAASFDGRGHSHTRSISGDRSQSPPSARAPRLPEVDFSSPQGNYAYGGGYQPATRY